MLEVAGDFRRAPAKFENPALEPFKTVVSRLKALKLGKGNLGNCNSQSFKLTL